MSLKFEACAAAQHTKCKHMVISLRIKLLQMQRLPLGRQWRHLATRSEDLVHVSTLDGSAAALQLR